MKQHWWMARVYTGGHYQTTDAHQTGSTAPTYRLCRSVSSPASSKTWFLLLHLSCSSSEVSEKKIKVCSSFCYTAYLTLIHVTVTFLTHCLLLFTAKQDSAGSPHKRAVDHAYLLRGTLRYVCQVSALQTLSKELATVAASGCLSSPALGAYL